uniref:Uncharacterized protein n=1 Tax=Elaeophora elaphi TaxID=1147741 RepID=A0A0R3RQ37_9BILA
MSSAARPVRRSRRNVNTATTSTTHLDNVMSVDSSAGDASPPVEFNYQIPSVSVKITVAIRASYILILFIQIRRRRLNSDDPMEGCSKREGVSTRKKTDAKIELGVRLIAQMRLIHNTRRTVALERTSIGNGNEDQIDVGVVGNELTFEDNTGHVAIISLR